MTWFADTGTSSGYTPTWTAPQPVRERFGTEQLQQLAKPLPDRFIHRNPSGGGEYVTHSVINQKLLAIVGPFDFQLVSVIRGDLPEKAPNPKASSQRGKEGAPALTGVVVGAVCRLTMEIDERETIIEEIGDCEDPRNWPHDGARMKDAMSDAFKRCAMRVGLGLHLWAQEEYVLDRALAVDDDTSSGSSGVQESGSPKPRPTSTDTGAASTTSRHTSSGGESSSIESPTIDGPATAPATTPARPVTLAAPREVEEARLRVYSLDPEQRKLVQDAWRAEWGTIKEGSENPLTAEGYVQLSEMLERVEKDNKSEWERRRRKAHAQMNEVGIKTPEAKHEFVSMATGGATESTGKLTEAQSQAITLEIEKLKAADGAA